MRTIYHYFCFLRRKLVATIELWHIARQTTPQPNKEKVGQVRVGNGIIVRRIGEPNVH